MMQALEGQMKHHMVLPGVLPVVHLAARRSDHWELGNGHIVAVGVLKVHRMVQEGHRIAVGEAGRMVAGGSLEEDTGLDFAEDIDLGLVEGSSPAAMAREAAADSSRPAAGEDTGGDTGHEEVGNGLGEVVAAHSPEEGEVGRTAAGRIRGKT